MCHCHRSNQTKKKKDWRRRSWSERTNEKKMLMELEQLPYLHHRPHESSPHSYSQSTCHQFENFNLIKIQWTNDEDDDDEASALEIKQKRRRKKHAFRNFGYWIEDIRMQAAWKGEEEALYLTQIYKRRIFLYIFVHFLYFFYMVFYGHRQHCWNCADIFTIANARQKQWTENMRNNKIYQLEIICLKWKVL